MAGPDIKVPKTIESSIASMLYFVTISASYARRTSVVTMVDRSETERTNDELVGLSSVLL